MTKLVDSHCHLNYYDDLEEVLMKARDLAFMHTICTQKSDCDFIEDIVCKHKKIYGSYGVHPCNAKEDNAEDYDVNVIVERLSKKKIIAIGETGIDLFHSNDNIRAQEMSFLNHIEASLITGKPLVIHCRSSRGQDDAVERIDSLLEQKNFHSNAIIHCFDGSSRLLDVALKREFYISVAGICTFNSARELQENIKKIPLNKLLIETDSPYLAPHPYRSKQNHPHYVYYVAQKISEILDVSVEGVIEQTYKNYTKLYQNFLELS